MAQAIYNAFATYKASYDGDGKSIQAVTTRPDPSHISEEAESETATQTDNTEENITAKSGERIYKVQFMALPKKLKAGDKAFKGLSPVDVYHDNGYYKYTYGEASSRSGIEKAYKKAKSLFKDAFVIVMQDGKRIE